MNFDDIEKKLKEDGEKRAGQLDKDKVLYKALNEPAPERTGYITPGASAPGGGRASGEYGKVPFAAAAASQPGKLNKLSLAAVIVAAIALLGMAFMFVFVFLINGADGDIPGGNVPVYLGMQVSGSASIGNSQITPSSFAISGDHTGRDGWIDQEAPFGENSADLEAEIQSTLGVLPESRINYYADQNEDILITVKLSNPDNYVILSFSLNGVFYQSYQFQDGSDSANLILKTNVGNTGGISEYTIDAIKYIDGTEIKDVVFSGEQTVNVGVRTERQLTAEISGEAIGLNDVSFNADITDRYGLLESLGGSMGAVLFDGEKIVDKQVLNTGANAVNFSGLMSNTVYQYAVYAYYNNLDGSKNGASLNMLAANAFATRPTVLFNSNEIVVGKESVSFALSWDENASRTVADYIDLYHGGQRLRSLSGNSVSGLLSNNNYEIILGYKNNLAGSETISLNFTTESKTAAGLDIINAAATKNSITFDIDISDPDSVGQITAIELYKDGGMVSRLNDYSALVFTNLTADTAYEIRVTYSYDLNDGEGTRTVTESKEIITPIEPIEITSVYLLDENPRPGEPVDIIVGYTNASSVKVKSFYFGEKKVAAAEFAGTLPGSNAALTFVPDIIDGKLSLVPTAVEYISKGITRTMETIISPGLVITESGGGETTFVDFYSDAESNSVSVGEAYKLIVKLDNPSGYLAFLVKINNIVYSGNAITLFGNNYILISMPAAEIAGDITYNLTQVELAGLSGTIALDMNSTCTVNVKE